MMKNEIICLAVLRAFSLTVAFDFSCPTQANWSLRAKSMCISQRNYSCLFDVNLQVNVYRDKCIRPRIVGPGYKYVFQPNPNRDSCSVSRYQPFVFNTIGYSECAFLKSLCKNEGMETYTDGTTRSDRTCSCDTMRGFSFVGKQNHECFCNPSSEDCSCYRRINQNNRMIDRKDSRCYNERHINQTRSFGKEFKRSTAFTIKNFDNFKYNIVCPTNRYRHIAVVCVLVLLLSYTLVVGIYCIQRVIRQWTNTPKNFETVNSTASSITIRSDSDDTDNCQKYELGHFEKPLSKEQRTKIIRNYTTIIGSIQSIECLVDHMVCEDVFSYDDMENIYSKGSQRDKNRAFLSLLLRGSQKGYTDFIRCLQEDDTYRDIANKIEKTVVKQVENGTLDAKPLINITKEQQTKIKRNYSTIVDVLKICDMLDHMVENEVFSLEDVEKIYSKTTTKDQTREFVAILLTRIRNGYREFIKYLREEEVYNNIADLIENTVVKDVEDEKIGIMTKEQELKIKKNRDAIIEELRFDDVVDYMITTGTLCLDDVERINSKPTTKDKNREFVRILIEGKRGYEEFIRCLLEDERYRELANEIKNTVVKQKLKIRHIMT